jgi:hypothetical protein
VAERAHPGEFEQIRSQPSRGDVADPKLAAAVPDQAD